MTTRWTRKRIRPANIFLDPYRDGFAQRTARHSELLELSERFEARHKRTPTARELWQFELDLAT